MDRFELTRPTDLFLLPPLLLLRSSYFAGDQYPSVECRRRRLYRHEDVRRNCRPGSGEASLVEKFIQTLKQQVLWIERFATLEELRRRVRAFARTYNEHSPDRAPRRPHAGGGAR